MKRVGMLVGRILFVISLLFFRWAFALAGKPLRQSPKRLKASPSDRFRMLVERGEWRA